jgi:hypothetical protein
MREENRNAIRDAHRYGGTALCSYVSIGAFEAEPPRPIGAVRKYNAAVYLSRRHQSPGPVGFRKQILPMGADRGSGSICGNAKITGVPRGRKRRYAESGEFLDGLTHHASVAGSQVCHGIHGKSQGGIPRPSNSNSFFVLIVAARSVACRAPKKKKRSCRGIRCSALPAYSAGQTDCPARELSLLMTRDASAECVESFGDSFVTALDLSGVVDGAGALRRTRREQHRHSCANIGRFDGRAAKQ